MKQGEAKRLLALTEEREAMKAERTPVLITFVDGGVFWAVLNGIGQVELIDPVFPSKEEQEVTKEQLEWVTLWRKEAGELAALPPVKVVVDTDNLPPCSACGNPADFCKRSVSCPNSDCELFFIWMTPREWVDKHGKEI